MGVAIRSELIERGFSCYGQMAQSTPHGGGVEGGVGHHKLHPIAGLRAAQEARKTLSDIARAGVRPSFGTLKLWKSNKRTAEFQ